MKYRYSKFTGDELDELDLEELLSRLSDLMLSSGFEDPYGMFGGEDHSLQALHDAILEAILNGGLLSDETLEALLGAGWQDAEDGEARLDRIIQKIIERLQQQGYVTTAPGETASPGQGQGRGPEASYTFEITDKSLDFLGFRALRDLLGSMGKSSLGRHDTREMATGVEASAASKPYEFGDTLNLDAAGTILNAVRRRPAGAGRDGLGPGIDVDLRGSDGGAGRISEFVRDSPDARLQPQHDPLRRGSLHAGQAGRARAGQPDSPAVPGDALKVVLFHDSAEEIALSQLARAKVGPYYTNTREGLRLARRLLERQQKDMRQIVMITDGKPSALTRPDGRIYRNAFGLDPLIVSETFAEVAACRKAGILINTFMLAHDHDLVSFVRKVAEICHGKAYFTTPRTLGQYVLMDYMDKKTRTIH